MITQTAPVNKIIPFSSVDGPGNRTAVFLQGCNFNCKYCHNPETRSLCINCGDCVATCPAGALHFSETPRTAQSLVLFDPVKCVQCDTCIHTCTHDASPRIRNLTPAQTFAEIQKQMPYIRGITVSGGECTLYPAFLTELFKLCQSAGLTTFIDSNGTYDFSSDPALMAVTDSVMLDIKAFDPVQHLAVTDCDNAQVLRNAVYLAETHKLFEVRTVVVPDLFDPMDTIMKTGNLLKEYLPIRYKIICYRPMGVRSQYSHYQIASSEYLESLAARLRALGWSDIVII